MKTTARSFSNALGRSSRLVRSNFRACSSSNSSRRTFHKFRAMDTDTGSGKQSAADTMSAMDDELAMQLERLRIAERENAELKRQIDELERELDIDFEALSLSEDEALLQEASLDLFESESSSGPTLPKLDSSPVVAYATGDEEEDVQEEYSTGIPKEEVPKSTTVAIVEEKVEEVEEVVEEEKEEEMVLEDVIPVDEVQEHVSPVEDALLEQEVSKNTTAVHTGGKVDVDVVEVEEEKITEVVEGSSDESGVLLASLPKVGELWSLVPKATLRVGKAGVTEQVVKQLREQLEQSDSGLVKVQLFNKQLEPLDVANDLVQQMSEEGVIVAESKGRTLLFTKA